MNTHTHLIKGVSMSLAGYLFMALMSSCVKELQHIPTMTLVFFQFLIPLAFTLPEFFRHGISFLKINQPLLLMVRCTTGMLSICAMFFAIKHIPLVNAVLLQNTIPLFVPIVMMFWLRKTIPHILWSGLLIGFIGVALILKPSAGFFSLFALIGLSSGVLSAMSLVAVSLLKATNSTNRLLFYFFLIGALLTSPFVIINWVPLHLKDIILLLATGLFMYLAQMFIVHALQYAKPSALAPLSYSTVIFTGLLGWAIWGHVPDLFSFVGICLVIIGGTIVIMLEARRQVPTDIKPTLVSTSARFLKV